MAALGLCHGREVQEHARNAPYLPCTSLPVLLIYIYKVLLGCSGVCCVWYCNQGTSVTQWISHLLHTQLQLQ